MDCLPSGCVFTMFKNVKYYDKAKHLLALCGGNGKEKWYLEILPSGTSIHSFWKISQVIAGKQSLVIEFPTLSWLQQNKNFEQLKSF